MLTLASLGERVDVDVTAIKPASKNGVYWALVLGLALVHTLLLFRKPYEDAFITFRYVDNLLAGHGLVYNYDAGERVEGFTCFGWVMLLSGTRALGLPLWATARTLSTVFGLGIVALTAWVARREQRDESRRWVAAALLVAAHGTWAHTTSTGMETTAFCWFLLASAIVVSGDLPSRAWLAGVLLAVATLIRPEGVGYAGLMLAVLAIEGARREALRFGTVFACVFVPYFALRWSYFGWPLPNTYYAKASPSLPLIERGLGYAGEFVAISSFWILPFAFRALRRKGGVRRWDRVSAAVLLGAVVNAALVGGDPAPFFRFLLPAIPFGAVLLVRGGRLLLKPRLAMPAFIGVAVVTLLSGFAPRGARQSQFAHVQEAAAKVEDFFVVGKFLRAHFPPDTVIAVNTAGIVPYVSGLSAIDMLGLNDTHIAHRTIELGHGVEGHEKFDAAYVLRRRPEIIIPGLPRPRRSDEAVDIHFAVEFEGTQELRANPELRREYRLVSAPIESDGYVSFYLRSDVPLPRGAKTTVW